MLTAHSFCSPQNFHTLINRSSFIVWSLQSISFVTVTVPRVRQLRVWLRVLAGSRYCLLSNYMASGTHPAFYSMNTMCTLPGAMWPGREPKHPSPSHAEFRSAWSCISTPPYAFITCSRTSNYVRIFCPFLLIIIYLSRSSILYSPNYWVCLQT